MNEEKKTSTKRTTKSTAKKPVKKSTTKTTKSKTTTAKKKTTTAKTASVKKKAPVKVVEPIVEVPKIQEEKKEVKIETKEITTINYMSVIAMLLGAILIVLILCKMYGNLEPADYSESYLIKNNIVHQINCDEIANAIQGEQSFIFVTSLNNEEEYKLEKKLANIIKENKIEEDFYVFNNDNHNCGPLSNINSVAGLEFKLTEGLDKIPTILYYRDGNLTEVLEREDEAMLTDGDFVKLLDIYLN